MFNKNLSLSLSILLKFHNCNPYRICKDMGYYYYYASTACNLTNYRNINVNAYLIKYCSKEKQFYNGQTKLGLANK